jgi:hypothetical protein
MELSKIGNWPVCSLWTRLLTHSSVHLALSRSLNFNNPRVSSGKLSSLSLLKSWRYSARQKLINSSVGKPVSFDHHESVVAFSGVSARAVFTGLSGCANQYHVRRLSRSRMGPLARNKAVARRAQGNYCKSFRPINSPCSSRATAAPYLWSLSAPLDLLVLPCAFGQERKPACIATVRSRLGPKASETVTNSEPECCHRNPGQTLDGIEEKASNSSMPSLGSFPSLEFFRQ